MFPEPEQPWVDRLLATDLLKQQRARAARTPVSDDVLRTLLMALQEAGGTMTHAALQAKLGLASPARLVSLLPVVRRLLNLEGYQVLEDADGTVKLNADLLHTQFGVRP